MIETNLPRKLMNNQQDEDVWTNSQTSVNFYAMKKETLHAFTQISVVLTGFSNADLTGTGLIATYYETVLKELGAEETSSLLATFERIKISNPEQITAQEERQAQEMVSGPTFKTAISQVIQLWYTGQWNATDGSSYIISSHSYLEGLVWKAIAAHPMGGKQPGYGTWSYPPLTFSSNS